MEIIVPILIFQELFCRRRRRRLKRERKKFHKLSSAAHISPEKYTLSEQRSARVREVRKLIYNIFDAQEE